MFDHLSRLRAQLHLVEYYDGIPLRKNLSRGHFDVLQEILGLPLSFPEEACDLVLIIGEIYQNMSLVLHFREFLGQMALAHPTCTVYQNCGGACTFLLPLQELVVCLSAEVDGHKIGSYEEYL